MTRVRRVVLTGAALSALIATASAAPPPPKVFSVVEGRDSATDRPVLVLIGSALTKFTSYQLTDPLGKRAAETPQLLLRSKTMVVLGLATDLPAGAYDLAGHFGKQDTMNFSVKVGNGAPLPGAVTQTALATTLRIDLDDASTLGGQTVSSFHDATNIASGTLDPSRFSAYDDLVAESKIGTDAKTVAAGDHDHDKVYPLRSELSAAGTVNASGNPLDWSQLKNVPAGFADGVDGNTTYSPGTGLSLAGTTFSLNFAGTGTATTAARSDHTHSGTYLPLTGGSLTGPLNVTMGSAAAPSVVGANSNANGYGIYGAATSATGVNAGLHGSAASTDGTGLWAEATSTTGTNYGVYATTNSVAGYAIYADSLNTGSGLGVGVFASSQSDTGRGVYASCPGIGSVGVLGETTNTQGGSIGVWGRTFSSSGTAVFGLASGTSGGSFGVYGRNSSTSGYGAFGQNDATSGSAVGVGGKSFSSAGTGVFGEVSSVSGAAVTYGVHGKAVGSSGRGVFGENTSTNTSALGFGVYGQCGIPLAIGVYGDNTSTTGVAYGVFGRSSSSSGVGMHGEGSTGVEGMSAISGGVALQALAVHSTAQALVANNTNAGTTASIASFQVAGVNKARIDQTGKGFFNGGTQTGGADFAESVAVAGPRSAFEPGDVIVIDTGADRSFALSMSAESTLVAGVYSTKPGVLAMPRDCAGDDVSATQREIPLAVVGIVPVKVCDEGGAIGRGDLLVTASLPGYAMKAPKEPKAGTLLGKALGRLEKGKGRIEVYLMAR